MRSGKALGTKRRYCTCALQQQLHYSSSGYSSIRTQTGDFSSHSRQKFSCSRDRSSEPSPLLTCTTCSVYCVMYCD